MKHFAQLLVSLVLMVLPPLTSQAQGVSDAFYIYQNDGHFNGFFYDEVIEIRYSKLDTLNLEHSDFVSQEIVTADSTYRIMLAAIDSVGFVQPEIIENPHMRNVIKEGIPNYLLSKEDLVLTFSKLMPADLIPKVNDVLADFSTDGTGYSGKVVSVDTSGSNIVVQLKDIESIHDLYRQFVSIEEYARDENGNNLGRRVAGKPELNTGIYNRRSSDKFDFNIFNFSLSGHLPIYTSPKGDVNISVDTDISSAATLKVVTNFPLFGKDYVGFTLTLNNTVGFGFTADGKMHDVYPAGLTKYFGKLPIPAAAPLFILDFGPDGFVKAEAHAKFHVTFPPFKGKLWYTLEFDDWSPSINFGHGTPPGEEKDEAQETQNDPTSVELEFNGTLQGGVKFPLTIFTNKLLEKLVKSEVGTTIYLGPKFTGAINFSLSRIVQDKMSAYNLLKDSKLNISYLNADYETKATMKTLLTDEREWTLIDGSINLLGEVDAYVVPDFELEVKGEGIDYWPTMGELSVKVTPSRNILWPVTVGYGVFKGDSLLDSHFTEEFIDPLPAYSQFSKKWREKKSFVDERYFTPGKYDIRPMFKIFGSEIIASPAQKVTVPGVYIYVSSDSLHINDQGKSDNIITIESNCDQLIAKEASSTDIIDVKANITSAGDSLWTLEYDTGEKLYNFRPADYMNYFNIYGTKVVNGKNVEVKKLINIYYGRNEKNLPKKMSIDILLWDNNDGNFLWCSEVPIKATKTGKMLHIEYKGDWPTYDNRGVTGHAAIDLAFDIDCDTMQSTGHLEAYKYYDLESEKDRVDHILYDLNHTAEYKYYKPSKVPVIETGAFSLYFE